MALGTVAVRAGGKKPKSERLQLATRCVSAAVAAAAAAAVRQWRTFSIVSPPTAPPPPPTSQHYPPPQRLRPMRRCRLLARAGGRDRDFSTDVTTPPSSR